MNDLKKIYVDWNDCVGCNYTRIDNAWAMEDIKKHNIEMKEGVKVLLYGDDVEIEGTLHYSEKEKTWVATYDKDKLFPK